MSDTVKLIIEIPKETYEYWKTHRNEYVLAEAIGKGIPLDTVKTEIDKAYEDFDDYDPSALGSFECKVFEILNNNKERK